MKMNKKSGFTLIEIIVVLIIVGVLAAIALPNLFSNVSKSRGAEALATMGGMKSALEACYQSHSDVGTSCTILSAGYVSGNFLYTMITANGAWSLSANGSNGVGSINFARVAGGTITCTATGNFAGIC